MKTFKVPMPEELGAEKMYSEKNACYCAMGWIAKHCGLGDAAGPRKESGLVYDNLSNLFGRREAEKLYSSNDRCVNNKERLENFKFIVDTINTFDKIKIEIV